MGARLAEQRAKRAATLGLSVPSMVMTTPEWSRPAAVALEEEPTVVVTAAAVTGVAATGAAEERMQEVAVAQATEAVEVQVAVALAAVVRCSDRRDHAQEHYGCASTEQGARPRRHQPVVWHTARAG